MATDFVSSPTPQSPGLGFDSCPLPVVSAVFPAHHVAMVTKYCHVGLLSACEFEAYSLFAVFLGRTTRIDFAVGGADWMDCDPYFYWDNLYFGSHGSTGTQMTVLEVTVAAETGYQLNVVAGTQYCVVAGSQVELLAWGHAPSMQWTMTGS